MTGRPTRAELVSQLAAKVRQFERRHGRSIANFEATTPDEPVVGFPTTAATIAHVPTGIAPLDTALPGRGVPLGSSVELLGDKGFGSASVALAIIRMAWSDERLSSRMLVIVDPPGELYPPALAGRGIDLSRTVFVRPSSPSDHVWALDECLRSNQVAIVLSWLPRVPSRELRRLQLANEAGSAVGLWLRPAAMARETSFAPLRLVVSPVMGIPITARPVMARRRLRLELRRGRGIASGKAWDLELDDESGELRVVGRFDPVEPGISSGVA